MDVPQSLMPTSTILSATHGRQRRSERDIDKVDLKMAKKYGMKQQARHGRVKYTFRGVVFIYDPKTNKEVTSFQSPYGYSEKSGTCVAPALKLGKVTGLKKYGIANEGARESKRRSRLRQKLQENSILWTSHSVLVVDMSGSMRRDDVNGARCRADGVWLSIAKDYIKTPLERKEMTYTDVLSIIIMRDSAEVLYFCEPLDWFLYNKIVDLREWDNGVLPYGHGCYAPALRKAEELLSIDTSGSCALSLLFFSDGRPSDCNLDHKTGMGELASKFGRRLTISCIGMAYNSEESYFDTLKGMAEEADSFGAVSSFCKPEMKVGALSHLISSLSSSLTTTKTELTDIRTGEVRRVRTDIRRERKNLPEDEFLTANWKVFKQRSVGSFWGWSFNHNDFVELYDYRCNHCGRDTRKSRFSVVCVKCDGVSFCSRRCLEKGKLLHEKGGGFFVKSCKTIKEEIIEKKIIKRPFPSYAVAMKRQIFGEGAERIVSKFRFLDDQDEFIGPVMVAKDSRHVVASSYSERLAFHKSFLRTQSIASEMAMKFNKKIDSLESLYEDLNWKRRVKLFPRIYFLEPIVGEFFDEGGNAINVLVEPFMEGKYEKFNNNMGYVKDVREGTCVSCSENIVFNHPTSNIYVKYKRPKGVDIESFVEKTKSLSLGAIIECEGEDDDKDDKRSDEDVELQKFVQCQNVNDSSFPQAFSHFTYEESKKNFMVVDLQGVFTMRGNGKRFYELTDPVIQTHSR